MTRAPLPRAQLSALQAACGPDPGVAGGCADPQSRPGWGPGVWLGVVLSCPGPLFHPGRPLHPPARRPRRQGSGSHHHLQQSKLRSPAGASRPDTVPGRSRAGGLTPLLAGATTAPEPRGTVRLRCSGTALPSRPPTHALSRGVPGQPASVPSPAPAEPHPSHLLGTRILASKMQRRPNSCANARIS